jgi:hypothetical protein
MAMAREWSLLNPPLFLIQTFLLWELYVEWQKYSLEEKTSTFIENLISSSKSLL